MLHIKPKRLPATICRRIECLFLFLVFFLVFSYLRSYTFQTVLIHHLRLETFHVPSLLVADLEPHVSFIEAPLKRHGHLNSYKGYEAVQTLKQEVAFGNMSWVESVDNLKRVELEEAANMMELQQMAVAEERQEWLRKNWAKIHILEKDNISEQFSERMKRFLNQCPLRFFTVWIAPLSGFGSREQRSLESIFKAHPSACLTIISRSLDMYGGKVLQPFVDRGLKIMAITPDLPYLFRNTPAQMWFQELKKGRIDPGDISFSQNLSNLVRLAALYKYGGVYLDMDVIVLRDMSNLSNAIGAQSADSVTGGWTRLNNAVMIFDRHHSLLFKFIQEFTLSFNGSRWGHNGPYMVTRVVRQLQSISSHQCAVLPPRAFYPVNWLHIDRLFRFPASDSDQQWQAEKLQQLEREGYVLHLWNRKSKYIDLERGSIVDIMFHRHCIFCKQQAFTN